MQLACCKAGVSLPGFVIKCAAELSRGIWSVRLHVAQLPEILPECELLLNKLETIRVIEVSRPIAINDVIHLGVTNE